MLDLSEEQWSFIALLRAFAAPVPINVIGTLAPLLPGPARTARSGSFRNRP